MFVVLLHFYSAAPTPAYGEIAAALRRRSHKVWIGQPAADGTFVFLDGERVVEVLPRAPRGRLGSLGAMIELRARLQAVAPDVVQMTPHPWSWVLALPSRRKRIVINDVRTAGSGAGAGARAWAVDASAWLSWRIGAAAMYDATLFLNDAGARWLFGNGGARKGRVVPLGVGAPFLTGSPAASTRRASAVRFIYLGTLSLSRQPERMLAAARLARAKTAAFTLTLLGPDDGVGGRNAVQTLIERFGLEDVVRIADPVPYADVPRVLREHDVAVNYVPATRVQARQSFMKVLECRALGMPQIATRTPPNQEAVRDGENGLLVDDSSDALATAMTRIVDEPDLLERLRRGAAAARQGTSWDEVAERQLAIYAELVAGR